jgi:hypothetical protein
MASHESSADIWVPGKRQFGARREDSHSRGVRGLFRRQHECCLCEIEPAGDRLHLVRFQRLRIAHHGERISTELAVGENIDGREFKLHAPQLGIFVVGWVEFSTRPTCQR